MLNKISKKEVFFRKSEYLLNKYQKIIVVETENIGSIQFQKCRKALGGSSVLLLGKITSIKKVLEKNQTQNPRLKNLKDYIEGNIGLIFTNNQPYSIKEVLSKNSVPAPAKTGQLAQCDVIVPAGPTNITPDGTSFFQALNIPTKISKGQIEIQDDIKICSKGSVIGESEVSLLNKLGIIPFSYELKIKIIYDDGLIYFPTVLDINKDLISEEINETVRKFKYILAPLNYPSSESITLKIQSTLTSLFYIGLSSFYYNLPVKKVDKKKIDIDSQKKINQNQLDKSECPSDSEEDGFGLGLFE
mmetsp:Transcript_9188/g.14501  ORF Transcript_9188/g.14501 Transcript_9188/m.14501 type:complete len:302 (+) Transcript_9188:1336-2241(+)